MATRSQAKIVRSQVGRGRQVHLPNKTMKAAKPLAGYGGDRFNEFQQDSVTTLRERGTSYLAARIKRDCPEVAAAVERGEVGGGCTLLIRDYHIISIPPSSDFTVRR